jgi:hypothetical protein
MHPLLALALTGCAPDTTPTWAFDPIWLEPAPDLGVHGFQTWQLYGPAWIDSSDEDAYACAVVVELFGEPAPCDADPECVGWEIGSVEVASSDCDEGLTATPLFLSLQRIGLGGPDRSPEAPWPDQTSIGWADYGNGWEVHGAAYAEVLDLGGQPESASWDGLQPYLMVPTQSFALSDGGTGLSSSGPGAGE